MCVGAGISSGHTFWEMRASGEESYYEEAVSGFHNVRLSPVLVNPSSLDCVTVDKSFSLSGPQFANE